MCGGGHAKVFMCALGWIEPMVAVVHVPYHTARLRSACVLAVLFSLPFTTTPPPPPVSSLYIRQAHLDIKQNQVAEAFQERLSDLALYNKRLMDALGSINAEITGLTADLESTRAFMNSRFGWCVHFPPSPHRTPARPHVPTVVCTRSNVFVPRLVTAPAVAFHRPITVNNKCREFRDDRLGIELARHVIFFGQL